jgi:GNAT superfamily N-acetyltransferase
LPHLEIIDSAGDRYRVDIVSGNDYLYVFLAWRNIRIANAKLSLHDDHAELCDIVVKDDIVVNYSWWRQLLGNVKTRNFRSKGLGTKLLFISIGAAKARGVDRIQGERVGEDLARLRRWYQSAGFLTLPDSNAIVLNLKSEC